MVHRRHGSCGAAAGHIDRPHSAGSSHVRHDAYQVAGGLEISNKLTLIARKLQDGVRL